MVFRYVVVSFGFIFVVVNKSFLCWKVLVICNCNNKCNSFFWFLLWVLDLILIDFYGDVYLGYNLCDGFVYNEMSVL